MFIKFLTKHQVRQLSTLKNDFGPRLAALRTQMSNMDALQVVVPSEDAHQSEYTAECDNRRAWISGFTGSAGCAVIEKNKASLFTDGRYFLQASKELDEKHWTLMKQGLPDVPTWQEYLVKNIPPHSNIGIDPSVISYNDATTLETQLKSIGSQLIYVNQNLVDKVRSNTMPARPSNPIQLHPFKYAGKSTKLKLNDLRLTLDGRSMVVSALDDIAWLLNLRGSDIHCCPVFFSYLLVTPNQATLYIQPSSLLSTKVKDHLEEAKIDIRDYNQVYDDLQRSPGPFLADQNTTNMSIIKALGGDRIEIGSSPIHLAKAIKNESELNGMRSCHQRDAVALCKHFSWLSNALVEQKQDIREFEAASHLEATRALDPAYVGLSFDTIAATGPNGAIIHYSPDQITSPFIDPRRIYLCDSGAQYLDGTTDITRTFMFSGEPTEFQKRAFTRVMQSHIAVDRAVFPQGTTGYQLDSIARTPLWMDGLDFRHGVGHGVGAYLNVHEGPHGIGARASYKDIPLEIGMVVTNEPGYYEDGQFGIRIENVLTVRKSNSPYRFGNRDYLGFEHMTFVPFGRRLLDMNILSVEDQKWINQYHQECRDVLEPLLKNDSKTLSWVERETEPLL